MSGVVHAPAAAHAEELSYQLETSIRATPDALLDDAMDTSMALGGRSTLVGLLAVGVAR